MKLRINLFILLLLAIILGARTPAAAQTGTVVRVDPAYSLVQQGDEFVLTIQIDDVANLYAYDVFINFPPDKLEGLSVVNGSFLPSFSYIRQTIDNVAGTVWIAGTQIYPTPPQSGSGTLVVITFQAEADQTDAAIVLSTVELSDDDGFLIDCITQDGRVQIGDYRLFLPLVRK